MLTVKLVVWDKFAVNASYSSPRLVYSTGVTHLTLVVISQLKVLPTNPLSSSYLVRLVTEDALIRNARIKVDKD